MSKYSYDQIKREISGMGGGYEEACRKMVIAGMEWLDEHPGADISYKEYKNIYGITTGESDDCKAMQKHMNEAIDNEASGAMMQACSSHILAAKKMGWDGYVAKMNELHAAD